MWQFNNDNENNEQMMMDWIPIISTKKSIDNSSFRFNKCDCITIAISLGNIYIVIISYW